MHNVSVKPTESLYAFLYNVIDYAGLFPPASLSLNEAFKNYLDYLQSPYSWMVSKFICSAKQLPELDELMGKFDLGTGDNLPLSFSVLCTNSKTQSQFRESLESDLNYISNFMNKNKEEVKIETIEFRSPDELFENYDTNNFNNFLKLTTKEVSNCLVNIHLLFCEIPFFTEWKKYLDSTLKNMFSISSKDFEIGFKFRTGGTEASTFPSSEQIANVFRMCRNNNVKMKCTAGLHHPVRHFSDEVNTKMHGFLNVFAAGMLAFTKNLTEEQLTEILNDECPDNFKFSEISFSWKDYNVSLEEISEARENFIVSFGSCSFDEPVNDLKSLNLL